MPVRPLADLYREENARIVHEQVGVSGLGDAGRIVEEPNQPACGRNPRQATPRRGTILKPLERGEPPAA